MLAFIIIKNVYGFDIYESNYLPTNVALTGTLQEYDASTTVTVDVEGFELIKEKLTVFPNPTSDNLRVTLTNAPCGAYIIELIEISGSVNHSQLYENFDMQRGVNINVRDYK